MVELDKLTLAFIGAGQMGGALLNGLVLSQLIRPDQIVVSDKNQERVSELKNRYKIGTATGNIEATQNSDVLILAVKPQDIFKVTSEIADVIKEDQLIISIAAGVATESILASFSKPALLVRVMPNSPAMVRRGISVISPSKHATDAATKLAGKLLSAVGEVLYLEEKYLNEATAISGSGPAYFYLFVEALIDAAEQVGLKPEVAAQLVSETYEGAGAMLKETQRDPYELRKMVTSPGGTTEAALEVFNREDFKKTVKEAVRAAVKRAEELG